MEKRLHRTPFQTENSWLNDRTGQRVAICETPQLARFLAVTANSFDDLTEALRLCRGEIHLEEAFRNSPAIQRILEIADRVEKDLRG